MSQTDSRVVRTKQSVQSALLRLLRTTPYAKLSVSNLAQEAGISRRTFYLHYHSIDEVMDELIEKFTRDASEILARFNFFGDEQALCDAFVTFAAICGEHKETIECLTSDPDCRLYLNRFAANIHRIVFDAYLSPDDAQNAEKELTLEYIVNGTFALFNRWLTNGHPIPIEEAAHIAFTISHNGLSVTDEYSKKDPA